MDSESRAFGQLTKELEWRNFCGGMPHSEFSFGFTSIQHTNTVVSLDLAVSNNRVLGGLELDE